MLSQSRELFSRIIWIPVLRVVSTKRLLAFSLCLLIMFQEGAGFGQDEDVSERVSRLVEYLKHDQTTIRRSAVSALGKIGPPSIPALSEALKDKDKEVRFLAATALGRIGPGAKAAVPALTEALKDEGEFVRYTAAETLGRIGPGAKAAVPALIEAVNNDVSWRVPISAAIALGKIGPGAKAAVPALVRALKDENGSSLLRRNAAETLAKIGSAAVPALVRALKDEDEFVRYAAVDALGKIFPDRE